VETHFSGARPPYSPLIFIKKEKFQGIRAKGIHSGFIGYIADQDIIFPATVWFPVNLTTRLLKESVLDNNPGKMREKNPEDTGQY
jgi:hypothetical protein